MKVRAIIQENGVLKLVHRGGHVEKLKNPITAAEVMKRNPRQCVTRPDVFEFPWIVVRPESVLKPGRVYFVVPYHTIHRLLQAKGCNKGSFVEEEHYAKTQYHCYSKLQVKVVQKRNGGRQTRVVAFGDEVNLTQKKHDCDYSVEMERSHRLVKKHLPNARRNVSMDGGKEVERKYQPAAGIKVVSRNIKDCSVQFPEKQALVKQMKDCRLDGTKLKSCLKKDNDTPKSPRLKVRFVLPIENDTGLRKKVTSVGDKEGLFH